MLPYLKLNPTDTNSAYKLYMAVKLHFKPGAYDGFKYNFSVNMQLKKPFDRIQCEKFARKYKTQYELMYFLVTNVIEGAGYFTDFSEEVYLKRRGYIESHSYKMESEITNLARDYPNIDLLLNSEDIIAAVQMGIISLETFIGINTILGFLPVLRQKLNDPMKVLAPVMDMAEKYQPFLVQGGLLDYPKIEKILKEKFTAIGG